MGTQSGREREAAPEGVRGAREAADDACRARQAGPLATKEAAMPARYTASGEGSNSRKEFADRT